MNNMEDTALQNIYPEILYVIDRNCTSSWKLDGYMEAHNMMLIYEGEAIFTCNDTTLKASKGDIIYYKPGDRRKAHTFSDNPMSCYGVDFVYTIPKITEGEWELKNEPLPFKFLEKICDDYLFTRLSDLFGQLTKIGLSTQWSHGVQGKILMMQILSLLVQYKQGNQYNFSNMKRVDRVINYMTDNYKNQISLKELADHIQLSPSYLGYIFKKVTGISPIEYLLSIRINKAKGLLLDGVNVTDTANLVGFNDVFYFSKAFKKHEGISPSQYLNLYSQI